MRGKAIFVLFVIVFLLAAAVVGTFLREQAGEPEPPAVETPDSEGIVVVDPEAGGASTAVTPAIPSPTLPLVTAFPAPEYTPSPTQAPVSTPTATQLPVQTSYGQSLGSGTFRSDTGVGLNLKADWSAKTTSASQVEVTVAVSVDSYSLHLTAMPGAVNVNFDGQYVTMDAPAVDYDGSGSINTPMSSKTFSLNLSEGESSAYHIDVVWNFGGSYQDVELPAIECGGDFFLSR